MAKTKSFEEFALIIQITPLIFQTTFYTSSQLIQGRAPHFTIALLSKLHKLFSSSLIDVFLHLHSKGVIAELKHDMDYPH